MNPSAAAEDELGCVWEIKGPSAGNAVDSGQGGVGMLCPWALRLGENAAPAARRARGERGWHSVAREGMALWATSLAVA